jgi:glycosyltransferase involved in cell wall biosynthesis
MVTVSCSGKFHAFNLAEQLEKENMLTKLYTLYAYQKNTLFRKIASRIDKEDILSKNIKTNIPLAFISRLQLKSHFEINDSFDTWVKRNIERKPDSYKLLIGWSGMSLNSIRQAKLDGKITILERGSSHINYQNEILIEEYNRYGVKFSIDQRVIDKEEEEYAEADYITIPSKFVKQTFLERSIKESKLIHIPYGVGLYFNKEKRNDDTKHKFRILYLGNLSIRKGLIYLFEAIKSLSIKERDYEVWFIGNISNEISSLIKKYERKNWRFFGHINHYNLADYIIQCDVGIQPSIEEGLSMVIPQMLNCGVPVIATVNTGGEDFIKNGINGYTVPIRSAKSIADCITLLYEDVAHREELKHQALQLQREYTWDDYGSSYKSILKKIIP